MLGLSADARQPSDGNDGPRADERVAGAYSETNRFLFFLWELDDAVGLSEIAGVMLFC